MQGIELVISTHWILIQGRNLQPLFDMPSRNRVEAIREHPSLVDHFPESATDINTALIENIYGRKEQPCHAKNRPRE